MRQDIESREEALERGRMVKRILKILVKQYPGQLANMFDGPTLFILAEKAKWAATEEVAILSQKLADADNLRIKLEEITERKRVS